MKKKLMLKSTFASSQQTPSRDELHPDQWLWCLHCERFFQAKDLQPDGINGEGCAWFPECDGAGLGVDIYIWDSWAVQNELKHWPKSVKELDKGRKCPLYV